jgi:hypothetical protein
MSAGAKEKSYTICKADMQGLDAGFIRFLKSLEMLIIEAVTTK